MFARPCGRSSLCFSFLQTSFLIVHVSVVVRCFLQFFFAEECEHYLCVFILPSRLFRVAVYLVHRVFLDLCRVLGACSCWMRINDLGL